MKKNNTSFFSLTAIPKEWTRYFPSYAGIENDAIVLPLQELLMIWDLGAKEQ